jgi:site-specific DNA-cytosine methylase
LPLRRTREVAPHFTPVSSALNLENRGETLGNRKKPLVPKTLNNIREGVERFHGQPFLLGYYNNPVYRQLNESIGTITTMDRWAYVTPATAFAETRMRMITPQEVKRCMGFPDDYKILGSNKQQVWQLGNAACTGVMVDILKRCTAVLEPEMERVA